MSLDRPIAALAGAIGIVALGGVIGLGSGIGPTLALAGTAALLLSVLAFSNLLVGVILMVLLTFFEAIATFGGGLTLVKFVGAVVLLSWIGLALSRRNRTQLLFTDQPVFSYAVVLFLGWVCASVLWARDAGASLSYLTRLLPVAALLFVAYSAIRETRQLRLVMWAYVGGAFATTIYGLVGGLSAEDRLIAGIANPNDLAAGLVPAIVLATVLAATTGRVLWRVVAIAALATCLVGVFMTESRGGIVSLAAALVVALVIGGALRPYFLILLLVISAAGLTYYAVATTATERTRLRHISAEGSSGRADEWQIAIRLAKDHPLLGVGIDNFREYETRYVTDAVNLYQVRTALKRPVTHNTYLQVLAELGVIGYVLLVSIYVGAVALGMGAIRRLAAADDRETELLGRGVVIAIASLFVAQLFADALLQKELWLVMGLLVAVSAMARRAPAPVAQEQPRFDDRFALVPQQ